VVAAALRGAGARAMIDRIIVRNATSRVAAKVVGAGLGVVSSILLVRYLGVERLGQYHYASTFAGLFGLLAGAGLPILLTREAARDRPGAGRVLGDVLVLQLALSTGTVIVVALAGILLNPWSLALPIAVLGLGLGLSAVGAPYMAMLNAFEEMHVASGIEMLSTAARVGLIVLAIGTGLDVLGLVTLLLLQPLGYVLATMRASTRYCARPHVAIEAGRLTRLLASTGPFALMVVLNSFYFRIDVVMLQKMLGDAAVGIYAAASKMPDALLLLGASVAGVLFPRMASQSSGSPADLARTIQTAFRYLSAAATLFGVTVTALAPWLVTTLFGEPFRDAITPLRILVWAVVVMVWYMPFAHALNATGREWAWTGVLALNSVVNVSLNFALIPSFGVLGAAGSTLVCELLGLAVVAWLVRRVASIPYVSTLLRIGGAAAVMGGALWLLGDQHPMLGVSFGVFGYGAALYVLGYFRPEERVAVQERIRALTA
jgi:O-antigen/teichoic acid export membrane protein